MSDINITAHGIDPNTGEYLSPAQRKALFKKGRMKPNINVGSFRSGSISSKKYSGGGGGGIVKYEPQDTSKDISSLAKVEESKEQVSEEVKERFSKVDSLFKNLITIKTEKKKTFSNFLDSMSPTGTTGTKAKKKSQEGGMKMPGFVNRGIAKASFSVFGLLGDLLKFKVLEWIGDPKNKKIVQAFVTVFKHVASFFNWFVTGVIDNLLSGFAELVGGDSILERIGGFFKLTFGIIGLRWLLNPLKIIKDLGRVFKFAKKFVKIFKGIFKLGDKGLKKSFGAVLKLAGKAFKVALGRTIKRVLVRVLGKTLSKALIGLTKTVVKGITRVVGRVPIVGPLIAFGVNLMMGEPIGRAAFKAVGATLLGGLGALIGSVVPVAGTFVGGVIGGLGGDWAGGVLYDALFGGKEVKKSENKSTEETPELRIGGVVSGPQDGYLAVLHGTEAVIPISRIPEILSLPFKALGSNILGAIFAIIKSMGSAGNFIRPVAISLLGGAVKEFGVEVTTTKKELGTSSASADTISKKIKDEREKQDLDKLFGEGIFKQIGDALLLGGGAIFGKLFGRSTNNSGTVSGGGSPDVGASGGDYPPSTDSGNTSSVGDMPGSGTSKGVKIAKMLQKDMGISAAAASGIVGNLLLESGLQPDNVENGKGFDDGPISNIPPGTRRVGYGWGQWTNDRLEKFRQFLRARGKENKPASDQDNYDYLLHELRSSEPIRGHWKGWQGPNIPEDDPQKAATWFMMNWERPGVPHQDKRQKYAQTIFNSLSSSSAEIAQQPTSPGSPGLTPEQTSSMFQNSGMSALSSNILSSVSTGVEREPDTSGAMMLTGTNQGPVPPVTPKATISKNTQTSPMPSMSNTFSIDRTIQSRKNTTQSMIAMMSGSNNYNITNNHNLNLNKTTSLSDTLVLNRI